jgi:hypothetical protein
MLEGKIIAVKLNADALVGSSGGVLTKNRYRFVTCSVPVSNSHFISALVRDCRGHLRW